MQSAGPYTPRLIRRPASGQFAARIGILFLVLCAIPALVPLPLDGMTAGHLAMLLGLPVWFAAALNRGHIVLDPFGRLVASIVITCCVVLIFLAVISALNTPVPHRSARSVMGLAAGPAMIMLMIGTVTRDRVYQYLSVACFAIAATGVLSIIATAQPALHALIFQGSDRASAFFKNPNQLGIVLSTILPVTLAMALGAERRRALWFAAFGIMLVALMLSGSKANMLISSLTLFSILLFLVHVRYSGIQRVAMMILTIFGSLLAGALLVSVLAALNPRALRLLEQFVVAGEATHSVVGRGETWRQSLELFRENPILGVGAGQPIRGLQHSHNLVIEYARTLGVPGVTFMMVLILIVLLACAALIWRALRARAHPVGDRFLCLGLGMGPVAYLAANMSSDSLGPTTSPYFFFILALGLISRRLLEPPTRMWPESPGRHAARGH